MISKSFQQRQLEELSFNKQPPQLMQRNLSTTHTAEDDIESVDESFQSQDEQNPSTARDVLLLKCRDAIESLHCEIEEERSEKLRLQEELQECQRFINDMQISDQDKNYKLQKLTEDSIQFQSDIHVLSKEKQRLSYERDELERKVIVLEPLQEESRRLSNERQQLSEQVKQQLAQNEKIQHEKQQYELQLAQLLKEKDGLMQTVSQLREQLLSEQKKIESNYKTYNEQMQELYMKEQERRETEVKREREERRIIEKEYQNKLEELQEKMERCLKEREREVKEELENKIKEQQMKYSQELNKIGEQAQKYLCDMQLIEKDKKQLENDKHSLELKILEINETSKADKYQYEKDIEQAKKEKERDVNQLKEELNKANNVLHKVTQDNQYLVEEIKNFNELQDKYEDTNAECLTLKQANEEYKKCLQQKVKEILILQASLDSFKKFSSFDLENLKQELSAKHNVIQNQQEQLTKQQDAIDHLESLLSVRDKAYKRLMEEQEEERDKLSKQIRDRSKEIQEYQEQLKLMESQKFDIIKKLTQLEEAYKRDSNLFRNESLKREEQFEEERMNYDRQLSQHRMHNEQTVEFIQSIKKELVKLNQSIEKKQEQYDDSSLIVQTIIDVMKRVIDSLNKRIDSFLFYSKNGKNSQKTLNNKENDMFTTINDNISRY